MIINKKDLITLAQTQSGEIFTVMMKDIEILLVRDVMLGKTHSVYICESNLRIYIPNAIKTLTDAGYSVRFDAANNHIFVIVDWS